VALKAMPPSAAVSSTSPGPSRIVRLAEAAIAQ
jgi:hypothetical protein